MAQITKLLKAMLLEEWRLHTTLLGNINFALFPVLIILFGFGGSLILWLFSVMFSKLSIVLFTHYVFLFFGANVGAFGLIGKEFMNRRFGQASLIAYSSRTLPVSERRIFVMMIIKDLIYYIGIWILPLIIGFACVTPIIKISILYAPLLLMTLTLSFLLGLSIVFFLSMLYARSTKLLFVAVLVIGIIAGFTKNNVFSKLPPYVYFLTKDSMQIWICIIIILVLSTISCIFVKFDFPHKVNRFSNNLNKISKIIAFTGKFKTFVAKDLLDLKRSNGGYGKVFFSFIIPVLFIWAFVSFFTKLIPGTYFSIFFSLLLGLYSSTIYTWLTQYDLFNQYLFMPVTVSRVIKSKMIGYVILNIISIAILLGVSILVKEIALFPVAIMIFAITSFFALSIAILYTGLSPSLMFMDVFVVLKYICTVVPFMSLIIFAFFLGMNYLITGVILMLILSIFILRKGFKKWDELPQQTF